VLISGGLIAVVLLALVQPTVVAGIGTAAGGLVIAGASFLLGGLIGFLFGIPRSLDDEGNLATSDGGTGSVRVTRANTNLEQISDWLTKILVGVGLTQIGNIPDAADDLGAHLGPLLGVVGGPAAAFAISLSIYFNLSGFLLGYFWTRVFLPRALRWGEIEVLKEAVSEEVRKDQLQESQDRAKRALAELAAEYRRTREWPSSDRRRLDYTNVFHKLRQVAHEARPSESDIRKLANSEDEGSRIAALAAIQSIADLRYADVLAYLISESRSGFEQYEALRAAADIAHHLSGKPAQALRSAVQNQKDHGWLQRGKNESAIPVADELLNTLRGHQAASD
jgi:hypothetical protein